MENTGHSTFIYHCTNDVTRKTLSLSGQSTPSKPNEKVTHAASSWEATGLCFGQ